MVSEKNRENDAILTFVELEFLRFSSDCLHVIVGWYRSISVSAIFRECLIHKTYCENFSHVKKIREINLYFDMKKLISQNFCKKSC